MFCTVSLPEVVIDPEDLRLVEHLCSDRRSARARSPGRGRTASRSRSWPRAADRPRRSAARCRDSGPAASPRRRTDCPGCRSSRSMCSRCSASCSIASGSANSPGTVREVLVRSRPRRHLSGGCLPNSSMALACELAELVVGDRRARVARRSRTLRAAALEEQVVERGQQLAARQVARRAEDHDRLRTDASAGPSRTPSGVRSDLDPSLVIEPDRIDGDRIDGRTLDRLARPTDRTPLPSPGQITESSPSPSSPSASGARRRGTRRASANSSCSTCTTATRPAGES